MSTHDGVLNQARPLGRLHRCHDLARGVRRCRTADVQAARETQQSLAKADQLIAAIESAGGTAPSREQIARVLGDDGGAVCANPNDALSRATFLSQLTNGATGPGNRPVIANARIAIGEVAIIKVYCPDELAEFQQFIDDLKTYHTGGA